MLLIIIPAIWLLLVTALVLWKRRLFRKTWQEPYFYQTPVLLESDDWGPGGPFHAKRLQRLLRSLSEHRDSVNRTAVLTADVVLTVPDTQAIINTSAGIGRKQLDKDFPEIYQTMLEGIEQDHFVPQLHGLEHLHGEAFARLCRESDPRVESACRDTDWWDWETLDSPLQGHYVDGSTLPTKAIDQDKAKEIIRTATETFQRFFSQPSLSTVAPCYLWNDTIEAEWSRHAIHSIQTAGYRCYGRTETGRYVQDKCLIRTGDKNATGQVYLVRNVMYEPVDGKNTADTAYQEALQAYNQALPITISTHRYNYTRSEEQFESSLNGLNALLSRLCRHMPNIRFLSSAELGESLHYPDQPVKNHFNQKSWPELRRINGPAKIGPFLYRLYYRHPKLAKLSYFSGLIIPGWLICQLSRRT